MGPSTHLQDIMMDYLDLQDHFKTLLCTTFYHLISDETGNTSSSVDDCYNSGKPLHMEDVKKMIFFASLQQVTIKITWDKYSIMTLKHQTAKMSFQFFEHFSETRKHAIKTAKYVFKLF